MLPMLGNPTGIGSFGILRSELSLPPPELTPMQSLDLFLGIALRGAFMSLPATFCSLHILVWLRTNRCCASLGAFLWQSCSEARLTSVAA